jgi:hypothetical protein
MPRCIRFELERLNEGKLNGRYSVNVAWKEDGKRK